MWRDDTFSQREQWEGGQDKIRKGEGGKQYGGVFIKWDDQ